MSDERSSNHRDTRSWCVDSRAQQCLTSFSHPPVLSLAFTACASCDARRRCCWLYMYRAQHPQQLHLPHMTKRGDAAEKGQKQEWAFAEFSGLSCAVHCARVLAVHASRLPHATAACASFCSPLCLRIVCPHRRSRLSRADASRSSPSRPGGLNCHRLSFGFMPFHAVFPLPEC